jgi:hypothetical protein
MNTYGDRLMDIRPKAPRRRNAEWTRYGIYKDLSGAYFLCKRSDSTRSRLLHFSGSSEAHQWFREQIEAEKAGLPTDFAALWRVGKPSAAPRKATGPLPRSGGYVASLRGTTPSTMANEVMARWGFRGIEFGRSVSKCLFLSSVHQAMHDLDMIGFGGMAEGVGLSCGVRTIRGSAGHYDPMCGVVSFPGTIVGGSVAHELWHAFEKRITADSIYASLPATYADRSRAFDLSRGRRYFGMPRELSARAFEVVVKHALAERGVVNDFLVSLANYTTVPRMNPWLTDSEVAPVAAAFRGVNK